MFKHNKITFYKCITSFIILFFFVLIFLDLSKKTQAADTSLQCFRGVQRFINKIARLTPEYPFMQKVSPLGCEKTLRRELSLTVEERCNVNIVQIIDSKLPWGRDDNEQIQNEAIPSVVNVCQRAVGNDNSEQMDFSIKQLASGTASSAELAQTLKCGFATETEPGKEANKCCLPSTMNLAAISDAFDSIPHECLIAGEVCVDDLAYLFIGDKVDAITAQKEVEIQDLLKESKPRPKCIVGEAKGEGANCKCEINENESLICSKYYNNDIAMQKKCNECLNIQTSQGKNVYTPLGCINTSAQGVVAAALSLGISLGGGVALLCIIYSAFILQTSANSPDRITVARETLTSCITGLIIIIFSVFILRFIGVDILKIPGFS